MKRSNGDVEKPPPPATTESQKDDPLGVPPDHPPPIPPVRKRSMDDREDDEDLFENPVSMTVAQLAPLSSISEVSLNKHNNGPAINSNSDEVNV